MCAKGIRLSSKHLCPLSHLAGPRLFFTVNYLQHSLSSLPSWIKSLNLLPESQNAGKVLFTVLTGRSSKPRVLEWEDASAGKSEDLDWTLGTPFKSYCCASSAGDTETGSSLELGVCDQ